MSNPPNPLAGQHVKQTQEEREGLAVWVRENRRAGEKPALLIAQPETQAVNFTALLISKGIENEFYGR